MFVCTCERMCVCVFVCVNGSDGEIVRVCLCMRKRERERVRAQFYCCFSIEKWITPGVKLQPGPFFMLQPYSYDGY